jgi:prolipoprotein diacylglyceryltransferase
VRQTLLYIPPEIAGLPVFGFGLLLAAWVIGSVVFMAWLVRKQGWRGDTWSYAPLLLLVAAIIRWLLPALCSERGLPIRGYGAMMLTAVVTATLLAAWRGWRVGLHPDLIFTLAFWLFVPGLVGARLFYLVEYWSKTYWPVFQGQGLRAGVVAVLNVSEGGLVVYGAFAGGVLGLLLFVRRYHLPLLAVCDLIAPSMLLGLALGRVGCLLNGCCFGGVCEHPWAVTFPWSSPAHRQQVIAGEMSVYGLTLANGPTGMPVVSVVEPGSPAERDGLKPQQQIREINGRLVDSVENADYALLEADKLVILIQKEDGESVFRVVDDPPQDTPSFAPDGRGQLRIYGLQLDGSQHDPPVITAVRAQSAEALAGLRVGQRIAMLNGRPVPTIGELRGLLETHRTHPWLRLETTGSPAVVELSLPRPLARSLPVHPTQVYSTIDALVLCLLLLAYDRFRRRDGALFALMITVYPITRFLVEMIRHDEPKIYGTGMTISQNVSVMLLLLAAGLWFYILHRPPEATFAKIAAG